MKTPAYYEDLPDSMTCDQLRDEFIEVLATDAQSEAASISEALFALSERQWNTYELADERLRADISTMILRLWDDQDADRAATLLGITSRLGLGVVLERLREGDRSLRSFNVRKTLEEAIREFGDTVDDPYSGMKT
jgi:hypothetical protein